MKRFLLVAAMLLLACSVAQAQLSEDWETGTDGWTLVGAGPEVPYLSQDQNTTPGGSWSLRTADNLATNYTNAMDYSFASETPAVWTASWYFFDTGATREYVQLQSYSPTGGLQQLISFGVYNAAPVTTGVYNFRVTLGSVGWADTTIARVSNVWHAMMVQQDAAGNVNFYIDGDPAASVTTTAVFGVTKIRVGSALTNNGHGAYYDDVMFTAVPEPGSLLALGSGLIGLVGFGIRRRR